MPKEEKEVSKWRRNAIWMIVVWLLLVIAIGSHPGKLVLNYHRLSKNGVTIQGIARGKKPHQLLEYSYAVNGRNYLGLGRTDIDSSSFYEISPGDKIPVRYLPDEPEISCLGNSAELYANDLPSAVLVSLLFPTMIVIALAIRISRNRRLL
ncbi:MAG: hypothetical protein JWN42_571 [Candidatus Angelobacter sp.]|nr:hypothetical protein [Candidatus Angelobacter sp.]